MCHTVFDIFGLLIIAFHLQNPNKIAVESLELSVNNDGVIRSVRAIVSKYNCFLSIIINYIDTVHTLPEG